MELTLKSLHDDRDAFLAAGYHLPEFDYDTVHKNTVEHPHWIHFGAGNIFRAFQANVAQNLLNSGVLDTGLIAAEGYDYEIIEKSYRPHDNLSILATLKADNTVEKTIVGSIMESLILDSKNEAEYARLREIFKNPSLQMASFTITEKGYATANAKGEFFPAVAADFEKGPEAPESYLGKVVSLLYTRYTHGALPIAMVSMDNCSHNGDKLYAAVNAFAKAWTDNGLVEAGFLGYVNDQTKVTFPWSMIDKITPRPDAKVEAMLAEDHIGGLDAVVTSKNTYIAPFVNAEARTGQRRHHLHRQSDRRQSGENEGMYLPESSAHRTGHLWLPSGIYPDLRRDEEPVIEKYGGSHRLQRRTSRSGKSRHPGSEEIH